MTATIRQALEGDSEPLQALYEALTGRPCRVLPSRISEIAADPANFLFVAESEGRVVGTLLVTLCLDAMYATQPFAILENLVVDASQRHAGIGQQLMRHDEAHCLAHDCSKIMLLSAAERTEAHRFFARLGYEPGRKAGFVKYRSTLVRETTGTAPAAQ